LIVPLPKQSKQAVISPALVCSSVFGFAAVFVVFMRKIVADTYYLVKLQLTSNDFAGYFLTHDDRGHTEGGRLMSAAERVAGDMFQKRPGAGEKPARQKRDAANPKRVVSFKIPEHLLAYVQSLEGKGYSRTAVFVIALQLAKDVSDTMGAEWWEVEKRANVANVPPGQMLARLALAALESERKKR
jgi:hypothetical protein